MQRFEAATGVRVDPETVFEFLLSFPRYAQYSEHLESVTRHGDGSPGTVYDLHVAWWRLSYTASSKVTDVQRPERIDWELVGDLDAQGSWRVEPLDGEAAESPGDGSVGAPAADGDEPAPASRVELVVEYDPGSADAATLGLPRLLSIGTLREKVRPLVRTEAERVVERVVADLEGEPRAVDLEITH